MALLKRGGGEHHVPLALVKRKGVPSAAIGTARENTGAVAERERTTGTGALLE